ncbi:SAM-dependent methyltransferase [Rhodoblastus sphagnicola]|uniref:class I SAM-dependent methyltransferase n=1 Tax=Rhodoblastus sphagnicola TaxID=333368 RepID=UPI0013047D50|nr:class I SAM-dependent methyltransferase [Rhodoblastus sphagnicola]MBB4200396.1 SAM-dependent methyltransferase [Rhodoblastus sphagnicola]
MHHVNIRLLGEKFLRSTKESGVVHALVQGFNSLLKSNKIDEFDLRYGTDTSGVIPLWRMHINSANVNCGVRYQAIPVEQFRLAIGTIQENLSSFYFVDLGCGKGRNLILAAKMGFAKVVGVEFARELACIAKTNLETLGIDNGVILCDDAVNFRLEDNDTLIYMYNPFSEAVMQIVADNIVDFIENNPTRKIYIVYHGTVCRHIFDNISRIERVVPNGISCDALIWKSRQPFSSPYS